MSSSSIPKTMKAVQVEKTGGVEVLDHRTDLPVPEIKDGEVLVKNDVVGVNCQCLSLLFFLKFSSPLLP